MRKFKIRTAIQFSEKVMTANYEVSEAMHHAFVERLKNRGEFIEFDEFEELEKIKGE